MGGFVAAARAGNAYEDADLAGLSCDMPEELDGLDTEQRTQQGQVTVGHLLFAFVFLMPVEFVIFGIKDAGGGFFQYVLGVPLGVGLGAIIGRLSWNLGRFLGLRAEGCSTKMQILVALGILTLDIAWMILGGIAGSSLSRLLVHRAVKW